MTQTEKIKIPCYTMKMQIYPSVAQKEKIEKIFHALHIAYNITFHEVFQKNPMVCTKPNENNSVWPDFRKITNAVWLNYLRECNPAVNDAPAAALSTNNGIFLLDAKRAWETGMHNCPVDENLRKDFRFYNPSKPRTSYMVQMSAKNLVPSSDNAKVAFLKIPGIDGKVKARGFNRKVWFGKNGEHTYSQALQNEELAKNLTVRVSKDRCGSFYVSITFSEGKSNDREIYLETSVQNNVEPIGIDVGVKDIAILSSGEKIENKHFKKQKDKSLRKLNRELSRRWGPANITFRDYNSNIRKENRTNTEQIQPLAKPSKRYLKAQQKKAIIERKTARRRDTYYNQQTARIVQQSSMIAVETLRVKNMFRNHKLAFALGDVAMSDFLSKLEYKAERRGIEIKSIGTFEASSQLCSVCGEKNPDVKNLNIRYWTCSNCGTHHDRDINAAKNILQIAQTSSTINANAPPENDNKEKNKTEKKKQRKQSKQIIFPDRPEIVVTYSKELTRINDPRYVIINKETGKIIDDAQGAGYRSVANAKNCFKAKAKYRSKS